MTQQVSKGILAVMECDEHNANMTLQSQSGIHTYLGQGVITREIDSIVELIVHQYILCVGDYKTQYLAYY